VTPAAQVHRAQAVTLFTAAADPNRLALLRALTAGPTCVCHLQEQVRLPSNRLSYHLKVLREAGLIEGTKRGLWIDYALVPGALDRLRAAVPTQAADPPSRDPADGCPDTPAPGTLTPIPVQLRTSR
jgi:ArsR family transcriptional regulator